MQPNQTQRSVTIFKDRTNTLLVAVGYDVSEDTITSQIRTGKSNESELIATWSVAFVTDGTDGELVLTLDDSAMSDVTKTKGYMDLKRVSNAEPMNIFDDPVEVLIKDPVTA